MNYKLKLFPNIVCKLLLLLQVNLVEHVDRLNQATDYYCLSYFQLNAIDTKVTVQHQSLPDVELLPNHKFSLSFKSRFSPDIQSGSTMTIECLSCAG